MNRLETLFEMLQTRPRPEDVAWEVLEVLRDDLAPADALVIEEAAKSSWQSLGRQYSSMATTFYQPTSRVVETTAVAAILFGAESPPQNLADIGDWLDDVGRGMHRAVGATMAERLRKSQRQAVGIYKSARWYNKRYRLLCRIEEKLRKLSWEQRKLRFTRIGKSAFATLLTREDFLADRRTACFVAYMSARMSLRSTFTNKSQVRAFDNIAEILLQRCERGQGTRWDVIASVLPDPRVLRHLSEKQKSELLARVWSVLAEIATMLRHVWQQTQFNLTKMIVAKGDDSSTWNQLAGAWNKARDHWIQLLHALGLEHMLDALCIGKVMRLMAADVARWHIASGGNVHPDTKVWAILPAPWDVLSGEAECTRAMVSALCASVGADPQTWTAQREDRSPTSFTPTPELVHGVVAASPSLALVLRKAGIFSGKPLVAESPGHQVERDANGFALRVDST